MAISQRVKRMVRVDQAGEYGAVRIYAGQLAVMGDRGPHSARSARWKRRKSTTAHGSTV
jgi:ubiquinone biosynthesis monooxygenase Coq7